MNTMFVLAVPRIVVGLLMVGHGMQKLAGWFGGPGLNGTAGLLDSVRIRRARAWALALGLTETVGGLAMAAGLFQPLGQIAVATVLVVAIVLMHWPNGLWNTNGGIEFPLVMATVASVSAAAPVGISLDATLGISVPAWLVLLATIGFAAGALVAIVLRRPVDAAVAPSVPSADDDHGPGAPTGKRPVRAVRLAAFRREVHIGC